VKREQKREKENGVGTFRMFSSDLNAGVSVI
jgi:hypothetical protein